jgi:hypothetical protein
MTGMRSTLTAGALAGYVASRTMDGVTTWFAGRQSEASRSREQELVPGGMLRQLGGQLGAATGRDLDDAAAERVGIAVHRLLATVYGMTTAVLVQRGRRPIPTGLAVGAVAFALVDEGTSLPLATSYPLVSHLRGVVGHATVGLTIGVLLRLLLDPGPVSRRRA